MNTLLKFRDSWIYKMQFLAFIKTHVCLVGVIPILFMHR